jgi:hypothetical protein
MTTIWAELSGNRADGADDGSPTLEHIIVRGESPHSLDFFHKKNEKKSWFLRNSETSPYTTQLEVFRIYGPLTKPNCMYSIPSDNSRFLRVLKV